MSNNNVMFKEYSQYMEKFYNPEFTAYDFLTLFSTLYASQKNYSFDRRNLINFIIFCKKNSKFVRILSDVNLKSNGIFYYSEELDEAVGKLKWGRILYTVSPEQDSTICIFEDIPISELVESRISYVDEITCFIEEYKEFENDKNLPNNALVLNKTKK